MGRYYLFINSIKSYQICQVFTVIAMHYNKVLGTGQYKCLVRSFINSKQYASMSISTTHRQYNASISYMLVLNTVVIA